MGGPRGVVQQIPKAGLTLNPNPTDQLLAMGRYGLGVTYTMPRRATINAPTPMRPLGGLMGDLWASFSKYPRRGTIPRGRERDRGRGRERDRGRGRDAATMGVRGPWSPPTSTSRRSSSRNHVVHGVANQLNGFEAKDFFTLRDGFSDEIVAAW